jgi:hypothetical protein
MDASHAPVRSARRLLPGKCGLSAGTGFRWLLAAGLLGAGFAWAQRWWGAFASSGDRQAKWPPLQRRWPPPGSWDPGAAIYEVSIQDRSLWPPARVALAMLALPVQANLTTPFECLDHAHLHGVRLRNSRASCAWPGRGRRRR